MAKTKISEFSSTPANNTDIDGINIAEGCAPSGINDAIRELMSQLKDWQAGTSNDPMTIGSTGSLTLSYGTANGVAYLNGSKVLTTGSALTFDGTTFTAPGSIISSGANPLFQGSSATGSAALSNSTAGAYIRVYGASHATRANYTDFINGSSTSTFDASGNLGLGVTPSAWSLFKAIQVNTGSLATYQVNNTILSSNAFYGSGGNTYISTGTATQYQQDSGAHKWYTAPSGTAGNAISFTQAMTLDASGNLALGITSTSGARAYFQGDAQNGYAVISDGSGAILIGGSSPLTGGTVSGQAAIRSGTGILFLGSGGTERARITSSGDLLVGATSANVFSIPSIQVGGSNANGLISVRRDSTASVDQVIFYNPNGLVGRIQTSASATSYVTSSDYRLKENVQQMTGALAKVAALKPVTYTWKVDGSKGEGFIAHELAEICPQAVAGEKDAVDAEGNPEYQGIDTSFLVATLTAAIQEQQAIINAQSAALEQLKAQLTSVSADVAALKAAA